MVIADTLGHLKWASQLKTAASVDPTAPAIPVTANEIPGTSSYNSRDEMENSINKYKIIVVRFCCVCGFV